jgi:hypothetical protein
MDLSVLEALHRQVLRRDECARNSYYDVTCFEKHVSEVAFSDKGTWNSVGNRLVETHIHGNG